MQSPPSKSRAATPFRITRSPLAKSSLTVNGIGAWLSLCPKVGEAEGQYVQQERAVCIVRDNVDLHARREHKSIGSDRTDFTVRSSTTFNGVVAALSRNGVLATTTEKDVRTAPARAMLRPSPKP